MIKVKCGACGAEYELSEENISSGKASNACPNCGIQMSRDLTSALGEFCRTLLSSNPEGWKLEVSNFHKGIRTVKVEGSMTVH